MSALLSVLVTACLCVVGGLVSCDAQAAGRLSFVGAVVTPTCPVMVSAQGLQNLPLRHSCASSGSNVGASRTFVLAVTRLDGAVDDKVLRYFDAYVRASRANAADPLLVTQTYE